MSRILVVDDDEMRHAVAERVRRMGHETSAAASGTEALKLLRAQGYDLVITDYRMDGMNGLEVVEAVKAEFPDTDVMVLTAVGTIGLAVEAMRRGAIDFVEKSNLAEVLPIKVGKAIEHRLARLARERLEEENRYLREEIGDRYGEIVGRSARIYEVLAMVEKVAATDSSVLIYGESGTGKELVARAIHSQSGRHGGPFVKVNCGALPRDLVESELFGHERGSFTGAVRQKKGKFELAQGGTIFLDEIGDVPLDVQVKLLRVLQEREFDRVGGEKTLSAEVRVVAATNQPLREMVKEGNFREDLYYRLEVIPMRLPPLRERKEDIPELVEHFVRKKCREMNLPFKRLTPEAMHALEGYWWPGNVRELENVIERTVVLADGEEVGAHDLPLDTEEPPAGPTEPSHPGASSLKRDLELQERERIVRAMEQARGVKTHAAELLGIKTSALYYKLDKYGLGKP
ncbi:MAG: sigma-54-dependent Fis family transcriptional regulator [Candidatus Handelsmanbacteria bacterium]|nr:sigma-54-dependent Fis family transcriptional regulator [Candidatus Handelsmanbacteria bacterium]